MGRPISAQRRERRQMPLDEKRRHQIRHRLNWHRTTCAARASQGQSCCAGVHTHCHTYTPRIVGDSGAAEEIVQIALIKVHKKWASIVASGAALPYVRSAVVRTAISWRRRRWHGERSSAAPPELADSDAFSVLDTRDRLRRALTALPRRQRAAVVLRHYLDVEEAETAAVLGSSTGTVKLPRPSSGNRVVRRGDVTDEGLLAGAPVLGGPQHRPCRRHERPPRARHRAG